MLAAPSRGPHEPEWSEGWGLVSQENDVIRARIPPGEPCATSEPLPRPPRSLSLPTVSSATCSDCLPSIPGGTRSWGTHFPSPLSSCSVRHKNPGGGGGGRCCSPYLTSLLSPGLDLTFQEVGEALHGVFSRVQYRLGRKRTVRQPCLRETNRCWTNGWHSQLPACHGQAPWPMSPITKAPSNNKTLSGRAGPAAPPSALWASCALTLSLPSSLSYSLPRSLTPFLAAACRPGCQRTEWALARER